MSPIMMRRTARTFSPPGASPSSPLPRTQDAGLESSVPATSISDSATIFTQHKQEKKKQVHTPLFTSKITAGSPSRARGTPTMMEEDGSRRDTFLADDTGPPSPRAVSFGSPSLSPVDHPPGFLTLVATAAPSLSSPSVTSSSDSGGSSNSDERDEGEIFEGMRTGIGTAQTASSSSAAVSVSVSAIHVAATTTAPTTSTNLSVMDSLEIPDPPAWVVYFLAFFILTGFVVGGVLACVTFPSSASFSLSPKKTFREWKRNLGKWKSRQGNHREGNKSKQRIMRAKMQALLEEEHTIEVNRRECFPEITLASGGCSGLIAMPTTTTSTTSAQNSPFLESGTLVRRKRNPKNLRVDTRGIGEAGLGICVGGERQREEQEEEPPLSTSSTHGRIDVLAATRSSRSTVSSSSGSNRGSSGGDSGRAFLSSFSERIDVNGDDDEDIKDSTRNNVDDGKEGFLKKVELLMDGLAGWFVGVFDSRVRDGEQERGLFFAVRESERERWEDGEGS